MKFMKELLEILTVLPEARISNLLSIISILLVVFIGCLFYFRAVNDKITVKHIIISLIYSSAFLLSVFWGLYYEYDEKNSLMAMMPICFWLLCLLVDVSIRYIKERRIAKRKMEMQINAVITEGMRGREKVLSCIMPEISDKEGSLGNEQKSEEDNTGCRCGSACSCDDSNRIE